MKLAPRLIASTAGTVFIAAGIGGALLIQLERSQLIADVQAETRVLARSVQVAVENALRDGQEPDVVELLERLETIAGQVDVMIYRSGDREALQASAGAQPQAEPIQEALQASRAQGEVLRTYDPDAGHDHRLVFAVPLLTDQGDRKGTLVISRPLTALDTDLRETTLLIAGSIIAFASATVGVMIFLLRRHVTGPLGEIARATDTLGRDLDAALSLPVQREDELGMVARAVTALQRRLRHARDARIAEAKRREALERQLREADKLISVGQLAAGVAHEIGSPLQVLVGRAHLLAQQARSDDAVQRQAALIAEHGERIARIVDRLQDVVRRRPSQIRPTDLTQPVRQVMWLLENEAHRRGVRLSCDLPAGPLMIQADPDEVQQVVLNLTLNALQACGRSGSVQVTVEPTPAGARLSVADDGQGIDEADQERIYEPFYTTREQSGGTGLGLAVVRSIVHRHRARVGVQRRHPKGTRFTVDWVRASA